MKSSRKDWVVLLAIVIAVVCPSFAPIGNPENLAALILLAVSFHPRTDRRVRTKLILSMGLLALTVTVSTLAGLLISGGSYTLVAGSLGPFVRAVICFQAIQCVDNRDLMRVRLLWLATLASAFAVAQFFLPSVAEFTSTHYLAAERSSVFTEDFTGGTLVRVIGFYENPSSVALMAIVAIFLALYARSVDQLGKKITLLIGIVHVVAGILSLSKVFFVGLPLVILHLLYLRYRAVSILGVLIVMAFASFVLTYQEPLADVVLYAIDATVSPEIALKGRYLDEQKEVVERSRVFGYGVVSVDAVMINDSMFLLILYIFGSVGMFIFFAGIIWMVVKEYKRKPIELWLMLTVSLLAGIGTNSIFGLRVDILLTAFISSFFIIHKVRNR